MIVKTIPHRVQELIASLLVVRDSLRHLEDGKAYHAMAVAGQLRALVADTAKGSPPLLVDLASFLQKEVRLYAGPGIDSESTDAHSDESLLELSGFPVSLHRSASSQRQLSLQEFLNEPIIRFKTRSIRRARFIKMMAEQAGGAHHSKEHEDVLAALLSVGSNGRALAYDAVAQLARCVVQCGAEMLRQLSDFSVHFNLLIHTPTHTHGGMLFDYVYPNSSMRLFLCHAPTGHLRCVLVGINGMSAVLELGRLVDWSQPRWIAVQQEISDDLRTTLRLSVDGVVFGEVVVDFPVVIDGDLTKSHRYLNRSHEHEESGTTLALLQHMILAGPVRYEAMGVIERSFRERREASDQAMVFRRSGWGYAAPGSSGFMFRGPVYDWSWNQLIEGRQPPAEEARADDSLRDRPSS